MKKNILTALLLAALALAPSLSSAKGAATKVCQCKCAQALVVLCLSPHSKNNKCEDTSYEISMPGNATQADCRSNNGQLCEGYWKDRRTKGTLALCSMTTKATPGTPSLQ